MVCKNTINNSFVFLLAEYASSLQKYVLVSHLLYSVERCLFRYRHKVDFRTKGNEFVQDCIVFSCLRMSRDKRVKKRRKSYT